MKSLFGTRKVIKPNLDRGGTPMLREHYPTDKLFEEILSYLPKMDASLAKIDRYLEDQKLYHLIQQDLSRRWANLIQPKTLEKFNERITQLAREHKVTKGRTLRTDGTVVETNMHAPSDSRQLADSVRVLARTVVRAKTILKTGRQKGCQQFQTFTPAARKTAPQIGETLSQRSETARETGRQKYQEVLEMTEKTVAAAGA